jgi:hypothetical protein
VRRGLVERPEDWEWSSFLQWATGAEAGSRSSVRPPRGGEKERNCCRRSWQPTLPHKTREGRGNRIQSRDCVEWASPPFVGDHGTPVFNKSIWRPRLTRYAPIMRNIRF